MKKQVGLWIDHRKTVMVTVEDGKETVQEVRSNIEKYVRFSNSSLAKGAKGPQNTPADARRKQLFADHFVGYYEGIRSLIRTADSIWIFGPGEAKDELEKCLKLAELGEHIVGVETAGKMTDRQIVARVRYHYLSV